MNLQQYRQLCQKNESENYLLDKLIFRKISIFITILFIKLKITSNQVTFLASWLRWPVSISLPSTPGQRC